MLRIYSKIFDEKNLIFFDLHAISEGAKKMVSTAAVLQ